MKLQRLTTSGILFVILTGVLLTQVLGASVSMEAKTNVVVGEEFSIDINVQEAQELRGVQFDLVFDEDVLELTTISDGTVLSDGEQGAFVMQSQTHADFIAVRLSPTDSQAQGLLAVATFVAKKIRNNHC